MLKKPANYDFSKLLIVPVGIEMELSVSGVILIVTLLIVPVGIEIYREVN